MPCIRQTCIIKISAWLIHQALCNERNADLEQSSAVLRVVQILLVCRCQISGALCEELAVVPEWFEDTKQHKFVLLKLVCVSPQLKAAKDSLLEGEPTELELWTFQVMNG